jgi:hypothetical protein
VSALVGDLPEGAAVSIAVGRDLDELGVRGLGPFFDHLADWLGVSGYLAQMSTAAGARRVDTGAQAAAALRAASNHGRTPISEVLIIGHSGPSATSLGGALLSRRLSQHLTGVDPDDTRFEVTTLGNPWEVPSFEEAVAANLPPGFWFASDASVRFLGCYTANVAKYFAAKFLRNEASAFGTTRTSAYFDDGTFGWYDPNGTRTVTVPGTPLTVEVSMRLREVFDDPDASRAANLNEYYHSGFWNEYDGKN